MPIKRILFLLFIVVTFFAEVGYAQLTVLPLTNTTKRTIVVMGSSSAFGWKATVPDSAWVNRLQTDLHFYGRGDTIINIANPGNTTYDCLPTGSSHPGYADPPNPAQNVTKALSYNPTFVIISLPTNDIADDYTNTETLANYTKITNALIAAHVPFILTGTQPRDLATDTGCSTAFDGNNVCLSTGGLTTAEQADLNTFNGLLATQYPSTGTPYATTVVNNFLTLLSVSTTNYEIKPSLGYGDGIHYMDAGHRIVYNTFINFQYYKDLVCDSQTITFGALGTKIVGTPDFSPGATTTSGLTITYSSDNTAVATITSGGLIHIVGAGTAHITASQAGNTHFFAATSVTQTLTCSAASSYYYDWVGGTSNVWSNPANWRTVNGGTITNPAADYPGDLQANDVVYIGVHINYSSTGPIISATLPNPIASLTFGDRLTTGTTTATNTFTVNSPAVFTVTGEILQKHSTAGTANTGNSLPYYTYPVQTYFQGSGTINCSIFRVGDTSVPTADSVINVTKVTLGSATGGATIALNVSGNFMVNTESRDNTAKTLVVSDNDAQFSLSQGTLTIGGQIMLLDTGITATSHTQFIPASKFSIDLYNTSDSPILNLQNTQTLFVQTGNVANKIDFYNIAQTGGTGTATVNYSGNTNQLIYNYTNTSSPESFIDFSGAASNDGAVYQNLWFSGSGTKTIEAGINSSLFVAGSFNVSGTATANAQIDDPALTVGGSFTTGSTAAFQNGDQPVTIGGSFSNAGTTNINGAMLTFNSTTAATLTTTNPFTFGLVTFSGGGLKTLSSGSFLVEDVGVLALSGNTQLAAGGNLTLQSDSSGSGTISEIPTGCSVTGNVNVQRYVSNHRAYRLASSAVYAATVNSNNVYSLNFISGSVYTTGTTGTAGGFDKGVNPTIYLYRENLAPLYTTFLNSNFRGVNNIASSPNYMLDVDGGPFNIPVGNGILFYYRGSRRQGTLTAETTAGAASTTDTLTETGTLNQGTITVKDWYTPTSSNLGFTTLSGNVLIEGLNLVGNPYPSTIDWDQYAAGDPSAGIYAPHVSMFSYQLVPTGAQGSGNYGVYQAYTDTTGTNGATNFIASGVGFFVQATKAGAQLVFSEHAKANSQVTGSALFMAKRLALKTTTKTTTNKVSMPYLRLQIAKDSINSDESIVRFDPQATTVFNPEIDAIYKPGTGSVSLSTLSSDKITLAINRVPLPKQGQSLAIGLVPGASVSGNYQLKLKNISQVPQLYNIWLRDNFSKDSVNMRTSPNYAFTLNTSDSTTFANRFIMVISQNPFLAYQLLSFNAQKTSNPSGVELLWKTQNEFNYTNFTVERSTDNAKTFGAIGGFESTGQGLYNLIDRNPLIGDNLYRLKQINIDSTVTYSNVVDVNFTNDASRSVFIYPNPAVNTVNLCVNTKLASAATYDIRITNSSGLVVKEVLSSNSDWQGNISQLLTGTYVVQVINNADKSLIGQAKFVKL